MAGSTGATGISVFSLLWSAFSFGKGTLGCCSLVSVEPDHFASLCGRHGSCLPTWILLSLLLPVPLQGTIPNATLLQPSCFLPLI